MKITVFTSNQPRHIALIEALASIADSVFVVQECNTVFPGRIADFFACSKVMESYFSRVIEAEIAVFGRPRLGPRKTRTIALKQGDLNLLEIETLEDALQSDTYIVFGSSYVRGALCDVLVENKALNIHVGTSPYYRGSSCNFWALYDEKPQHVGATIHMLGKGLDSGPMLFHALPQDQAVDPFLLGMLAVKAAHEGLVHFLGSGEIWNMEPVPQNRNLELRYSRNSDFTDAIASEYLDRALSAHDIFAALQSRDMAAFLRPYTLK